MHGGKPARMISLVMTLGEKDSIIPQVRSTRHFWHTNKWYNYAQYTSLLGVTF